MRSKFEQIFRFYSLFFVIVVIASLSGKVQVDMRLFVAVFLVYGVLAAFYYFGNKEKR